MQVIQQRFVNGFQVGYVPFPMNARRVNRLLRASLVRDLQCSCYCESCRSADSPKGRFESKKARLACAHRKRQKVLRISESELFGAPRSQEFNARGKNWQAKHVVLHDTKRSQMLHGQDSKAISEASASHKWSAFEWSRSRGAKRSCGNAIDIHP